MTIATQIDEGDYLEALGMRWNSPATDIAVAAARLGGEHPELARRITAIASVLRDDRQREIYLIARQERDNVLRQLEPQLRTAIRNVRSRVWTELQRLLRSEFELGVVKIGPRAARSLAGRHEWIREAVVNSSFAVLTPAPVERATGVAYRTLMVPDCAKCGGAAREYCDCTDDYRFEIPSGAAAGTLVGAYGDRTGRFDYMILDRPVLAPRPYNALNAIYVAHQISTRMGAEHDLTLEEAESWRRRQMRGVLIGYVAIGALVGLLVSSWLTGLIAAAAGLVLPAVRAVLSPTTASRSWTMTGACLALQPAAGALAGHALATTTSGLVTGLIMSVLMMVVVMYGWRQPT
jgi:hypothetical protein